MRKRKRLVLGLLLLPVVSFASSSDPSVSTGSSVSNTIRTSTSNSTSYWYGIGSPVEGDTNSYFYNIYLSSTQHGYGDLTLRLCAVSNFDYSSNTCSSSNLGTQLIQIPRNSNSVMYISVYVPKGYVLVGAYLFSNLTNGDKTLNLVGKLAVDHTCPTCPECEECPTCPDTPDDSECQEQLAQLSGDYNDLSEQYASLLLYNTSIESQLQQCLMSGGNSILSGMCSSLDLFWFNNDQMYSLPITNNLVLPNGFRALVDSGVQSIVPIQTLDYAYEIDDEDFQNVIDGYGLVFLYFFSGSLFLVFLYIIRRYFIGLKK